MKTIDEAAKEYVQSTNGFIAKDISFKVGAEFAQRWIPVEEELPEHDLIPKHGNIAGFDILLLFPNGKKALVDRMYCEARKCYVWQRQDSEYAVFNAIAWRLTDLKWINR